ncbi:hypothetical protein DMH17_15465 [Raoultella planticola]|nr:hypothetical protein [Raoultella planticola]
MLSASTIRRRLGGDEFAILLRDVHSEAEVKTLCASLSSQFLEPFNLHNGHTATLSRSASAMRWHGNTRQRRICRSSPIKICIG